MSRDWEAIFHSWSGPSSDTEATKCENAERMIRNAVGESSALKQRNIRVITHGSYKNNTNVRQNSDVDVVICSSDTVYYNNDAPGFDAVSEGFTPATYSYDQYKQDVLQALVAKFGNENITPGNKAIDIHANSYRVDADVVACFEYRRYTTRDSYNRRFHYEKGVQFFSLKGETVINWPEQHYANGVAKNQRTANRYKQMTRCLKRLRNEMVENSISTASGFPSYLIECLVYNVANNQFGSSQYKQDMRSIITALFLGTGDDAACQDWVEVNGMDYLLRGGQPWSRTQVNAFLLSAWQYVDFD